MSGAICTRSVFLGAGRAEFVRRMARALISGCLRREFSGQDEGVRMRHVGGVM